MKTDQQLKQDVLSELAWDPAVEPAALDVTVQEGMVTLTGQLPSYAQKHLVEKAVRRVAGVRGVALDLDVVVPAQQRRPDSDIAKAALAALRWHAWVPHERLQVQVEDGWVTLTGDVDWHYQLTSAEQCIRHLVGVRGLTNRVAVKPRVTEQDVSSEIVGALLRHARREASRIEVEVQGGVVTLQGAVDSLREHDAALAAAAATRGVSRVVDHLSVAG
ncbi:BON domain-containing protein [Ramlibacter sp.]|uniref:BON domain-containing protein n=1 Tax=Ramlibacter sp. TaxID=1917967 RepID=UPI002BB6E5B7|nr:BON domain-containing protein [Ramlibacter sp.]HWI81145.1 BON domain-containing protein [Ramlibacter sp.]